MVLSLARQGRAAGIAGLCGVIFLGAAVARAQAPSGRPVNCNAFKVDEKKGRITFNDPKAIFTMPEKEERDKLRSQGTPGQVFVMRNCDAPNLDADFPVFSEPNNGGAPAEQVPSASRVVVLSERTNWIQVRGTTARWKGTGWVRLADNMVLVRY
jgi:hypothetical protein